MRGSANGIRTVARRRVAGRWDQGEPSCRSCEDWSWTPARCRPARPSSSGMQVDRRHRLHRGSTTATSAWWNERCRHERSSVCLRNTTYTSQTCTQLYSPICPKSTRPFPLTSPYGRESCQLAVDLLRTC